MTRLPNPPSLAAGTSREDVVAWVAEHLGDLTLEGADGVRPGAIVGGQSAADAALAALDVTGYASSRSTVLPVARRGATRLSPYIRHGLHRLRTVWDAVADAPAARPAALPATNCSGRSTPATSTPGSDRTWGRRCAASSPSPPAGTANRGPNGCGACRPPSANFTTTAGW